MADLLRFLPVAEYRRPILGHGQLAFLFRECGVLRSLEVSLICSLRQTSMELNGRFHSIAGLCWTSIGMIVTDASPSANALASLIGEPLILNLVLSSRR